MISLIKTIGALMVVLGMAATAPATLFTFAYDSDFANAGVVPNGNPTGWSDTRSLTTGDLGTDTLIQDVNVVLNVSGGYNGDLYGYLVHSSGFCVLLDRVGTGSGSEPQYTFGFSTAGFDNVRLDDGSLNGNIHDMSNPANGTYVSDGGTLASFNGLDATGSWTLFLADMAGGGDPSTVLSWSLEIEAVPEPTTWALIGFGFIFLAVGTVRVIRARRLACVRLTGRE
jgi:hypothetical protein